MKDIYFLSVDYQYDFAGEDGVAKVIGSSPDFIKAQLIPFLRTHNLKVSEIISDYRLPRGKSHNESCVPGTQGFISLLPDDLRLGPQYIKCMHNPLWTRSGIGIADEILGQIYQDVQGFNKWVDNQFPNKSAPIVMFGETMECCLLNVAQELYFRGYTIYILYEGTDPMPERQEHKKSLYENSTLSIYANPLYFESLKTMLTE